MRSFITYENEKNNIKFVLEISFSEFVSVKLSILIINLSDMLKSVFSTFKKYKLIETSSLSESSVKVDWKKKR